MKKVFIIIGSLIILVIIGLLVLPYIKIKKDNKIYYIAYQDDTIRYDEGACYDDAVSYYKKDDITITHIAFEKKFIFYFMEIEYVEGNMCATEYQLEEEYITNYINNAEILSNDDNIDIKSLIEGKEAIVGNTRYSGNDYGTAIEYKLDGEYETMYVFYKNDLLIIQVGLSDEGPKFIAYK